MSDQQGWTPPGAGPPPTGSPSGNPSVPPPPPPPPMQAPAQAPLQGPPPPATTMPMQGGQYEYRPGIIALRPQSMSDVWGGVMTAIRGNPAATIGLALATVGLLLVPLTFLAIWLGNTLDFGAVPPELDEATTGLALEALVAGLVPMLALLVTSWLLPLFMAHVIGQGVQGRKVTMAETWAATRQRLPAAIGLVALLVVFWLVAFGLCALVFGVTIAADLPWLAVLVFVGSVALFILLWVRLGFAMSIVSLEQAGPARAISRSFALTKGSFWRLFGIRLLTFIIVGIAGSIMSNAIGLAGGLVIDFSSPSGVATALALTQAVATLVQTVLTTPFSSGVDSLLYIDQRIRREGLDMQLIQQAQTARPS